jgi:hypothetical protein
MVHVTMSVFVFATFGVLTVAANGLDIPDTVWLLYGDDTEQTAFADQPSSVGGSGVCSVCDERTNRQLDANFNTSLIDLLMITESRQAIDVYCEIHDDRRRCKQRECGVLTVWNMAVHVCTANNSAFTGRIGRCVAAARRETERNCELNCWQQAMRAHPTQHDDECTCARTPTPMLLTARGRECTYARCYLDCQRMVLRSMCKRLSTARATADLLDDYVMQRARVDIANRQHSDEPVPPSCTRLATSDMPTASADMPTLASNSVSTSRRTQSQTCITLFLIILQTSIR